MFLKKVNTLPPVPGKMFFISLSFFVLLMVLMYMHDNYEIKHQWYIWMTWEYNIVTITIKDNGVGAPNIEPGLGLTHMKERLDMLGGKIHVDGSEGFCLVAEIPIRGEGK